MRVAITRAARAVRSARAPRRRARSRPARRRTRTRCRCTTRTCTTTRTTRTRTRRTPRIPRRRITRRACGPRRKTSPRMDVLVLMEDPRSRRASAGAEHERGRSTSAPTASCSRTTRATWPPLWTSTSPARWPSTSPKRACRWRRATCRRRSSTRRQAARAPSSCTSTTPGTSTTAGTRAPPPPSTPTWPATRRCCSAAPRCTRSTSPWTGRRTPTRTRTMRTTRSSTPPVRRIPIPHRPVWRRRCRTRPRTCTGSERRGGARPPAGLPPSRGTAEAGAEVCAEAPAARTLSVQCAVRLLGALVVSAACLNLLAAMRVTVLRLPNPMFNVGPDWGLCRAGTERSGGPNRK